MLTGTRYISTKFSGSQTISQSIQTIYKSKSILFNANRAKGEIQLQEFGKMSSDVKRFDFISELIHPILLF